MNSFVLVFYQVVQFVNEFIENVGVFFFLDSDADPIHALAFFGGHGAALPVLAKLVLSHSFGN
jgi:hypothetical protein